ncbi:MAG: hypothetical protein RRC34_12655 [Lentisphaeria bacterium]|nr:hypothetical protein [Lentisphaeria bacterium]
MTAMDHLIIKEKKLTPLQGMIGGVVIGVLAVILLNQFVKGPITDKIRETDEQTTNVQSQLTMNRALVQQLPSLQKERDTLLASLKDVSGKLVSEETPVRWANAIAERHAAREKLTVRSFDARGINQLSTTQKTSRGIIVIPNVYEEFRTETILWGTFHEFGRFLANLETEFPAMRVADFSLRAKGIEAEDGLVISLKTTYLRFSKDGFPEDTRPQAVDQTAPLNIDQ